jgi:hypothetical protein
MTKSKPSPTADAAFAAKVACIDAFHEMERLVRHWPPSPAEWQAITEKLDAFDEATRKYVEAPVRRRGAPGR